MAKRGASMESDEVRTKCSKSYTSLNDVSCWFSGLFSLTDPVRIEAVHWRDNGCFRGCVQCRRKVDTKCSLHPDSGSKVYYRLRVLIRQWAKTIKKSGAWIGAQLTILCSINRKLRSGDYKEIGVRFLCSV